MRLTHQGIYKQSVLSADLVFRLITNGIEHDILVDFETVHDPEPEIVLKSRLEFNQKRMFALI